MLLPIDLGKAPVNEKDAELTTDYAQELRYKLRMTHSRAREMLAQAERRQKRNYDKGILENPLPEGSFVWLHCQSVKGIVAPLTSNSVDIDLWLKT